MEKWHRDPAAARGWGPSPLWGSMNKESAPGRLFGIPWDSRRRRHLLPRSRAQRGRICFPVEVTTPWDGRNLPEVPHGPAQPNFMAVKKDKEG